VITRAFDVPGQPDIDISIESGKVEIRNGAEGKVAVSVDTSDPGFVVEQRGSSIIISSSKGRLWRGSTFVIVDTPPGSNLSTEVASADIQVDIPLDRVDLKTASGDIDLAGAETLTVRTASGDLRVDHVGNAIRYTTASGDLFVPGEARGSVVVSSASGDIRIEECDAAIDINTVSGDVHIARFSGRSGNFKAMSGDVSLGIIRGTSLDLDVNLLSGKLHLPDTAKDPAPTERHMSVTAKLVSGDLRINRA
jgi:DUF4097 and DUF4098 domain-containing protein YvlB